MRKNNKVRASILQKAFFVISGLFLSLVILETGLRAGGFVLLSLQEYKNMLSLKQKGTYRIMCLGESTTQDQYPGFLEKILNQRNIGITFSVIDKGLSGANTNIIVSQLEAYLDAYKPDMVVTMMGINDRDSLFFSNETVNNSPSPGSFLKSLRTYKLLNLLRRHVEAKIKEIKLNNKKDERQLGKKTEVNPLQKSTGACGEQGRTINPWDESIVLSAQEEAPDFSPGFTLKDALRYKILGEEYRQDRKFPEAEQAFKKSLEFDPKNYFVCVELAGIYRAQEKFPEAENVCRRAVELDPKNEQAYIELGEIYRHQWRFLEAEEMLKKALKLNPENELTCVLLGILYKDEARMSEAEQAFKRTLELNSKNVWAYTGLGEIYTKLGRLSEAEGALKKGLECGSYDECLYVELGTTYMEQGKFSEAEDVFKKTLEFNPNSYWAHTGLESVYFKKGNSELFKEYMDKAGQLNHNDYLPRTIKNYLKLKQILDRKSVSLVCVQYPMLSIEPLKKIFEGVNGVIFVDNETIFKKAVENYGYKTYFKDMFAGDFGHCTAEGNRLLAENIAQAVLREIFNK